MNRRLFWTAPAERERRRRSHSGREAVSGPSGRTNALGCGEEHGYHEDYRGAGVEVDLLKKVRIEIAINEEFLEKCIAAIVDGAHSDKIGDGKIFISQLDECVRIRTGERGKEAIG